MNTRLFQSSKGYVIGVDLDGPTKRRIFIRRLLVALTLIIILVSTIATAYGVGRLNGALDPHRSYEIPMCAAYATDIRESPTGYIIGHIPEGSMIWFTKLDLPFAHVAFYDGSAWLEGTVTATALEVCP